MEKLNHSFEKGLSSDFSAIKQPIGTYPHAENIVRDVQGTVKSERGTTLLAELTSFTNPKIIGETVIGDEIIFFVTADEGSLITKLTADNTIQNILFTGTSGPGVGSEIITTEHSIGGEAIDGYDEAWLEVPKNSETNLLAIGDQLSLSGFGDDGTYTIKSKSGSGGGQNWTIVFTVLWNGNFGQNGTATWYTQETVETNTNIETYAITPVGSSDSEELSFADPTSALYDLVFTVVGTTTSVNMVYRTGGINGDPVDVDGILEYKSSSKLLPESLRPINTFEELYGDPAVNNAWGFIIRDNGTVAMTLFDDEFTSPREVYFSGTKTYTSKGISESTIISSDLLGFEYAYPIDAVSRKNYKGEIIIYWTDHNNSPRRLNTSTFIDASNFDDDTKLFLNPDLPIISNIETIEGGGVSTGLYKFAARLGTATGNVTTFSQISHGYPVVDDVELGGKIEYDGAPPQTPAGKTLKLTIDNIDTSYDFIEIALITYIGEENLLEAHVVGKKSVTNSSINFEYYSDTQKLEPILLESLIEDAIEYSTAKNILQKDNHLFLSNLTSQSFSDLDSTLQAFANQIEIHFTEKTSVTTPNPLYCETERWDTGAVEDWSQFANYFQYGAGKRDHTFRLKSNSGGSFENYKNPDYTYKYRGYMRDEVYSFAFVPIFTGNVYGSAYHIPGWSGNFSAQGIKGQEDTTRLRGWKNNDGTYHHRMPSTNKSKPYTSTDLITESTKILGITLKNIDVSANALLAKHLIGYTIVRQRRNKPGNGIITMQGIANVFYDTLQSSTINPAPFLGKTQHVRRLVDGGNTEVQGPGQNQDVSDKYFLFHSPDQEHGLISEDYLAGVSSVEEIALRSIDTQCDNHMSQMSVHQLALGSFKQTLYDVSEQGGYDLSGLQDEQTLDKAVHVAITGFDSDTTVTQGIPGGKNIASEGMQGGVVLARTSGKIHREYTRWGEISSLLNTFTAVTGDYHRYEIFDNRTTLEVYNILSHTNNVYGDLPSAEYIMVEERYLRDVPGAEVTMFGGDTFLSDYFFTLGNKTIKPYNRDSGIRCRVNVNTIIETRGNYEYRHYVEDTIDGDTTIPGTLPYFPKYPELFNYEPGVTDILGIWDQELSKGVPNSYNKHYNFENTLNKYYPRSTFIDEVNNFPDRIIYSLQSFENEQFDAYRTFLTNNFHDIPKETGEISNMFEYNNILYAHTPHSLWRTYVNEKTFTNTSSGEVVLGNGGLFPIPSDQIYTEEGGFAGSSAKWASTNTPYGRIFIDDHQRKVFMLVAKEGLREISDPYMFEHFALLLDPGYQTGNSRDFTIGYDPLNKRAILSLYNFTTGNPLSWVNAISYSFELQSWSSFHTYSLDRFATRDNRLIATNAGGIYEMGTGKYNENFNTATPVVLHIPVNPIPDVSKDLINLKWIQKNDNSIFSNIVVRTKEFTTGDVIPSLVTSFADEQNFLPLGQQHVHEVGGEYRMVVPPDNNPEAFYADNLFRPTIKGKYGVIELTYHPDSTYNTPLELEHFSTEYLKVAE